MLHKNYMYSKIIAPISKNKTVVIEHLYNLTYIYIYILVHHRLIKISTVINLLQYIKYIIESDTSNI